MAVDLNFATFIQNLQDLGVYNYFLPFILVFAITYALLEKSEILGDKKNVNVVISMVVGLILIAQQSVVESINSFLQKSSLIIIIALVSLLVIFLISGSKLKPGSIGFGIVFLVIIIALIWAISPQIGWDIPIWSSIDDGTKNFILMVLIFVIAPIILITRKPSTGDNILTKAAKGIENMLEKGGRH